MIDEDLLDALPTTPTEAFLSASTPNDLNGVELAPFGAARQAIALALGMQGADNTLFVDAVIMGYVCSIPDKKAALRLLRDKDQALVDAFDWAELQGYSISNFGPVKDLYLKVTSEITASTRARPVKEPGPEGNGGGLPEPLASDAPLRSPPIAASKSPSGKSRSQSLTRSS